MWNIISGIFGKLSSLAINNAAINADNIIDKVEKKIESESIAISNNCVKETPKWQSWFPFTFFYGNGKIQPLYIFVTLFSSLGVWMLYLKCHAASLAIKSGVYTTDMLSTGDLTVVLGFVSSLVLLYNYGKKSGKQTKEEINIPKDSGDQQN